MRNFIKRYWDALIPIVLLLALFAALLTTVNACECEYDNWELEYDTWEYDLLETEVREAEILESSQPVCCVTINDTGDEVCL